ncbi:MAG: dihydrofolate reductase [Burkholderiales bacterium]
MLNLIVAVAKGNVIGLGGKMPWHLPAELAYFKQITMGHPIIMGRKTFDSIGRPLPGRQNIVVTSNPQWSHAGVDIHASIESALSAVDGRDAFVIGGATLYQAALPLAQRIYLTAIDATVEGDTFFPELSPLDWREISRQHRAHDDKNAFAVDFIVLERRIT